MNTIHVAGLLLDTHIGVPDAERGAPQQLRLWLTLTPLLPFAEMADDVSRTIDYAEVCRRCRALAAERPRRLIETLVDDLAGLLLREFPCAEVELELRKYILPETEYVAVRLARRARG
ncbi:MAG: dihydroneopterin aldolase [Verrucomicrobia bacterium]|nr:dihydroneopterin aldolase [Verrucomicrobiota bacterium]